MEDLHKQSWWGWAESRAFGNLATFPTMKSPNIYNSTNNSIPAVIESRDPTNLII